MSKFIEYEIHNLEFKFIEYDIQNGIALLKCAIMNVLRSLDLGEITCYKFNPYIANNLIAKCMAESGWNIETDNLIWSSPHDKEFLFKDHNIYENYKS